MTDSDVRVIRDRADFEAAFGDALEAVPATDRETIVPGVGPLDARIVLVGEAPGAREAETGVPFVGAAGNLLDGVLEAVGADRSTIYFTNVVKVRPPDNRTPRVTDVETWRPVLEAELARIDPPVVVALGNVAARALLDVDEGITELRAREFERDGRLVVPTYHPAAPLYDADKRADLESDLRRAFAAAG